MPILDKNRIYDGFESLEGGVDAGRRPNVIGPNQCVSAENVTFRGGVPATRPGIRVMDQIFPSQIYYGGAGNLIKPVVISDADLFGPVLISPTANFTSVYVGAILTANAIPAGTTIVSINSPTEVIMSNPATATVVGVTVFIDLQFPIGGSTWAFENGIMQGACYYSPHTDNEYLMALIGGRLFRITPRDYDVTVDEIKLDKKNRPDIPRGCIIQADKWVVAQDNESRAIIYDGVLAHRALDDEVPTGELMVYGMGRIVVSKNGQDIYFGDLYGSNETGDPGDALIKFTETTFLTEGFPATVPFALGKITAMAFFPQLDTSTGTGQLFVFTDRGACGFDLSKPREQWKTSAFQQVTLASTGVRGWRSIQALNEDLWFRASDGARTFRQARSESHGYTHIPLSTNVRQWLDADTPELLDFASGTIFDNRYILTCTPVWNHGRPYHNGLLSLDFDILSSFGENARPAWEGHWSGLRTTQLVSGIFKGRRRTFVFAIDEEDKNQIYEFTNDRDDFDGPISSELVSRSFDFSRDKDSGGRATSSAYSEKELYGGDVWINRVSDHDATMRAMYRPDNFTEWLPFDDIKVLDIQGEWQEMTEGMEPTMRQGFYPRSSLEKPQKPPDPMTKRLLTRGFEFQTKFNWTGYMAIERFRIAAQQLTEKSRAR